MLEIGIGSMQAMKHVPDYRVGASLFMWEEYFPNAMIYGLDIAPETLISIDRIRTRQCDQSSVSQLLEAACWAGGKFDLILDDGSHQVGDQLLTAMTLMPFLREGGLFIIEDVNELEAVSAKLPFEHAVIQYKYQPTLTGRLILMRK